MSFDLTLIRQGLTAFPDIGRVIATFEYRLSDTASHPLAVAVSGGGDSVALLGLLALWGRRDLVVLNVDHGLNPQASQWAEQVANLCHDLNGQGLNVTFVPLSWQPPAMHSGIQAKARAARYQLLAEAAHDHGARVIILGHNQDDIVEAQLMRQMGSSVGLPKSWGPCPSWPHGRDICLYRPLLTIGRQRLRDWLDHSQISYINDPANENLRFLRAQARQIQAQEPRPFDQEAQNPDQAFSETDLANLLVRPDYYAKLGVLVFDKAYFLTLDKSQAIKALSAALVCVGGGVRVARTVALERLWQGINSQSDFSATLCGTGLSLQNNQIIMTREAHDTRHRHIQAERRLKLDCGQTGLFDGRFAITAHQALEIDHCQHQVCESDLPYRLRASLPFGHFADKAALLSGESPDFSVSCLVFKRFLSFLGRFQHEKEL